MSAHTSTGSDTATNVTARAVNTVAWLSAADTAIVVPVYQRQYRWDIGRCEQLLTDVRAVADRHDRHTHFLGSILSVTSSDPTVDGLGELVLIDGQQRITTLMLLAAAVQHTLLAAGDPSPADGVVGEIEHLLVRAAGDDRPARTKLRPHDAWAEVFERVVLGRPAGDAGPDADSSFDDNYAFFRSQISPAEAPHIWRGLSKLEHVAISLAANANAQQIFESLNSTGEPLRDHELIHNYVLMGLSSAAQHHVENTYWAPIERCTGDAIGRFWRHYLVMATGREVALNRDGSGERSVYDAFQQRFPRLDRATLDDHAAQWLACAQVYQVLLEPDREPDPRIARQLHGINVFGPGTYPLVMRVYRDYRTGVLDAEALVRTLEQLQALLLRRTVVEIGISRLVARLCRASEAGLDALVRAMARITPSDERVRVALKYRPLPHAGYVLGRLAGVDRVGDLDVEHVFPLAPSDHWTGDGVREWADYTEDEQNSHRALAQTLGNLTLLEIPLADRADELSYPDKRDAVYPHSAVRATADLAHQPTWGTAAIAARTARLTADLLRIWARPGADLGIPIDDDGLTPVLDAVRRRGWPRGWEREFDYVEYRGEHWEVHDVKYLFNRVFKRLWADARPDVEVFIGRRGGPIFPAPAWNGQWDTLDGGRHLYMGWDAKYMLTAVQDVLDEAGVAAEVYVKYSYIGELM
ncbi:Uncharacterized conserved protein, contains ParB-like and HNH nuclease domains [Nakamurella panacisegetis]|uniref:Uncharacterized conserved protein, contains ParB-like and HNH nuclease domains n=1 Tax=Nakamurella panacisegetis TaxID=1090615 RepID=A0A1H0MNV2_9ACTN|nr:DUF262 domain-containing protein [Nakamurella panacisegetis]SDO82024.1 Uncharacterized conserved protein, contains ParB-like and HNH nuclease domains [Nakamurella panacisegetis]